MCLLKNHHINNSFWLTSVTKNGNRASTLFLIEERSPVLVSLFVRDAVRVATGAAVRVALFFLSLGLFFLSLGLFFLSLGLLFLSLGLFFLI